MLKRGLAFALALVMLASVSVAGAAWSEVKVDGHHKYVSVADWSKADIEKAIKLNLDVAYTGENVQMSIARVDFAEDAAALVGLAYTDKADIADHAKADVQLMTHVGVMTDVGDGRFDPEGPYSVEDSLVGLYRLYQNTCVGKKPDQPDIFALTPRQKQIAQAYSSGPYITSAENDATFTIAYHGDTGYMAPTSVYIWVVDRNGTCHRYQNIIKKSSNAYRGTGEAGIDKLWLAEDGSKVYFQSTLKDDVYFYDNNGNRGKLLFAKGVYTVTLDVATGKQTYTRADLT